MDNVGNSGEISDNEHLIAARDIIGEKVSLTDLARQDRGLKCPSTSAKNLATEEARHYPNDITFLTFLLQASVKSAAIPRATQGEMAL